MIIQKRVLKDQMLLSEAGNTPLGLNIIWNSIMSPPPKTDTKIKSSYQNRLYSGLQFH